MSLKNSDFAIILMRLSRLWFAFSDGSVSMVYHQVDLVFRAREQRVGWPTAARIPRSLSISTWHTKRKILPDRSSLGHALSLIRVWVWRQQQRSNNEQYIDRLMGGPPAPAFTFSSTPSNLTYNNGKGQKLLYVERLFNHNNFCGNFWGKWKRPMDV